MSDYAKISELGRKIVKWQKQLEEISKAEKLRIRCNADSADPIILRGGSSWFELAQSAVIAAIKQDLDAFRAELKKEVEDE